MENKEKVTNTETNGVDFEKYAEDRQAVVTRGELADILGGVIDMVGAELDEVAQPALSVVSALNILITILKDKGLVNQADFVKAEKTYRKELKEVSNNG